MYQEKKVSEREREADKDKMLSLLSSCSFFVF